MAWDVTVPDTYAESHIGSTATKPGAAAHKTAQNKIDKYSELASTQIFHPFARETAGTWHDMATELTQEIGRRITTITEDARETTFLYQRLSVAHSLASMVFRQSPLCSSVMLLFSNCMSRQLAEHPAAAADRPVPDLGMWRPWAGSLLFRGPYPPSNAIIYMHLQL